MIRCIFISLFFFIKLSIGWCQNLVINPSFEEGEDPCEVPTDSRRLPQMAHYWSCPSIGTSDIFSTETPIYCYGAMPYSTYEDPWFKERVRVGSQFPRTGNRFAGFFAFTGLFTTPWGTYREYLQAELKEAMVPGESYCVEMYVSLSGQSGYACNNIGIVFNDDPFYIFDPHELPFTPQIINDDIISDSLGWVKIEGVFTATSPVKYLIIGNFYDDAHTNFEPFNIDIPLPQILLFDAYYFIDDVSVQRIIHGDFVFSGGTEVCKGDSAFVKAEIGTDNVMWYSLEDENTIIHTGRTLHSKPDTTTSYHVIARSCNAQIEDTVTVVVRPRPQIYLGNDTTICKGDPHHLDGGIGNVKYEWQDGSSSRFLSVKNTGIYSVITENEFACESLDTVAIVVAQIPTVDLGMDSFVCDEFVPLKVKPGDRTFLWSTGSTDSIFIPSKAGKYWVTVKNQCGESTDTITVYGVSDIFLPNVVTINQDNINEKFEIGGVSGLISPQLNIYNRWGDRIFSENKYDNTWPDDISIASGVYYFSLTIPGCSSFTGWIHVLH